MDIDKIYGVVTNLIGKEGGEIKVKAFRYPDKMEKGLVFDEVEICSEFPQSGSVYNHKLNSGISFDIGDLIEISISKLFPTEDDPKRHRVLHHSQVSRYGAKLFAFDSSIFRENKKSINLDNVESEILKAKLNIGESTIFYISNNNHAFGPFKIGSGKVEPHVGKQVSKFKLRQSLIIENGDQLYLFRHPTTDDLLGEVDCMNRKQILDWLKIKIKNYEDLNIQINQIIRVIDSIEVNTELDEIRFYRVKNFVYGLDYNFQEVRKLSTLTEDWKRVFERVFEKYSMEFENEIKNSIDLRLNDYEKLKQNEIDSQKSYQESELNELRKNRKTLVEIIGKEQRVINKYNDDIRLLVSELSRIEILKSDLLKEVEYISEQKQRLITDIKIHFQILEPDKRKQIEPQSIPTLNEQSYLSDTHEFYENYEQMLDVTRRSNVGKTEMFESTFHGLLCHNYLLANDEKLIIYFAKLFGKSKIIVQQVEPDWTKFEKLYNNGLALIWESASKDPDQFHFLILQDINLASIECYGKPLLDVISGIRTSIPGFSNSIPPNLYIIGVPLKVGHSGEFGLNLYKDTFANWGVLKDFEVNFAEVKRFNPSKILSQNTIQEMLDELDELGFREDTAYSEHFFEKFNA